MNKSDYLPSQDAKFDIFQDDLIGTVSAHVVAWGITPTEIAALTAAQTPWEAAWSVAKNKDNRTRAQITAKKLARKNYTGVLRPFIQTRIQRNPLLTADDIVLCGLKPRDTVRTRIPAPTGTPEITVMNGPGNTVTMYFKSPQGTDGSSQRGKPKGVAALLLVFLRSSGPMPMPPVNPQQCPERVLVSRSPKRFTFEPEDIGQRVYFFACWVNAKGEQGPWTDVQTFLIS